MLSIEKKRKEDKKLESYAFEIKKPTVQVVSFDVFDTLLLRPFFYPTDLFYFLDFYVSKILKVPDVICFSLYRQEAEKRARNERRLIGYEDISLEEIYSHIAENYPISKDVVYQLMAKEIELEKRFCSARQFGLDLFKYALAQGKRVIITSDMYLSSKTIDDLLKKNGISGYEKIFVSCETRLSKRSGRMFDHIAQDMNVAGEHFLHIGDNQFSDVEMPRKHGWKALTLYKPVDLLQNNIRSIRTGDSFWHSFRSMRSSQSAFHALDYFGLRCMLAIVANRVFDNPFSNEVKKGDYSGSTKLFGNLALGMYVAAQGLWLARIAAEENPDTVLFFSRDGWLAYQAYEILRQYITLPRAFYVHASRKSIYPLLLTNDGLFLASGSHIRYESHSRESITRILMPVLNEETIEKIKEEWGNKWNCLFSSATELLLFLNEIKDRAVDKNKAEEYVQGFQRCFEPYMQGRVLCYDIGYSVRNESILKTFFPETEITAAFSHTSKDISIRRARQSGVKVRTFNNVSPYVSWLVRECFLTADEPSCIGYNTHGEPVYEEKKNQSDIIGTFQKEALDYVKSIIDVFRQDTMWLPLELEDACLPFESFLHSPCRSDIRWLGKLYAENEADPQISNQEVLIFWKKLRTEYWIASHHIDSFGKHIIRFFMLITTDRKELAKLIYKRLG